MEQGFMGPGWTRLDYVVEQTGGLLPLHDLARLGLVKMAQEPDSGRKAGYGWRWWWVEDASLAALLAGCVAETRTRTIYHLPAHLQDICKCLPLELG